MPWRKQFIRAMEEVMTHQSSRAGAWLRPKGSIRVVVGRCGGSCGCFLDTNGDPPRGELLHRFIRDTESLGYLTECGGKVQRRRRSITLAGGKALLTERVEAAAAT